MYMSAEAPAGVYGTLNGWLLKIRGLSLEQVHEAVEGGEAEAGYPGRDLTLQRGHVRGALLHRTWG